MYPVFCNILLFIFLLFPHLFKLLMSRVVLRSLNSNNRIWQNTFYYGNCFIRLFVAMTCSLGPHLIFLCIIWGGSTWYRIVQLFFTPSEIFSHNLFMCGKLKWVSLVSAWSGALCVRLSGKMFLRYCLHHNVSLLKIPWLTPNLQIWIWTHSINPTLHTPFLTSLISLLLFFDSLMKPNASCWHIHTNGGSSIQREDWAGKEAEKEKGCGGWGRVKKKSEHKERPLWFLGVALPVFEAILSFRRRDCSVHSLMSRTWTRLTHTACACTHTHTPL